MDILTRKSILVMALASVLMVSGSQAIDFFKTLVIKPMAFSQVAQPVVPIKTVSTDTPLGRYQE